MNKEYFLSLTIESEFEIRNEVPEQGYEQSWAIAMVERKFI